MDRGPQRTEFSRAQNKGGGGHRSQTHIAMMPRKGGSFLGRPFSAFCSSVYIKTGHFRIFQVLILTFWNVLFKLESPKFPPPLPSSFKPCGPKTHKGNGKKAWDPKLSPTGGDNNCLNFYFCEMLLNFQKSE